MTLGEASVGGYGIRKSIVSVFISDTVRPAAWKKATMTDTLLASTSSDFETITASSAYNMPHTGLRMHANDYCSYGSTTPKSLR